MDQEKKVATLEAQLKGVGDFYCRWVITRTFSEKPNGIARPQPGVPCVYPFTRQIIGYPPESSQQAPPPQAPVILNSANIGRFLTIIAGNSSFLDPQRNVLNQREQNKTNGDGLDTWARRFEELRLKGPPAPVGMAAIIPKTRSRTYFAVSHL